MNKKIVVFVMLIILMITSTVIGAFLTQSGQKEETILVGHVDVEIKAYFEKVDSTGQVIESKTENIDYVMNNNEIKFGVIGINISEPNNIQYFDNFRVDILIKSSVYTYFRIAPYEQFTLTYESGGKINEVAVTKDSYSPFNYNLSDFYDNRLRDGFFYYKQPVRRENVSTPSVVTFIERYPIELNYPQYESRYSLQMGFIIEAVQFYKGPQNNWGLMNPPWDSEAEWMGGNSWNIIY